MRKTIALLLALVLALSVLAGCAKETPAETPEPTPSAVPEAAEKEDKTPDFDPAELTPAMWKVTDSDGHTLYLFGTIHVGDGRSEAVLEKIAPTMDACDALALEFDLNEYQSDLEMQMQSVMTFVLPDSEVTDVIPADVFAETKDLLTEAGVYNKALLRYNVQFWSTLVDQAVMMLYCDLSPEKAMDSMLCARAYANEQTVHSVESAQAQYDLLNSMSDELAVTSIRDTLSVKDTYGENLTEMYELWLSGDTDALTAFLETEDEPDPETYSPELIAEAEAFNKALTEDRNDGMLVKAEEYLSSGETVFLAVGAAHMPGEHGLVRLLTNAGYTVERVDY